MVDVIIKIVHVAVVVLVVAGQAAVSFRVPAFLLAVILIVQVVGLQVVAQPVHQVVVPGAVAAHIKLLAGLPALGHAMVEEVVHGLLAGVTCQVLVVGDVVLVVVHRRVLGLQLFQAGGGGLIVLAAQAAVPVVHVHVAAHAAHRAVAGILPHLIAAAVAAAGAPLRHPAVPVFKHRVGQVVVPPAAAGVNAHLVTRVAHDVRKGAGQVGQAAVVQRQLPVFLQIVEHRQGGVVALQQAHRVPALAGRLAGAGCIGVQIHTVGDAQLFALGDVALPLGVVLVGLVVAVAAADDRKLHARVLHGLPVNGALMAAHVNAPVPVGREGAHAVRQAQGSHAVVLRVHPAAVLVTPAVFQAGLGQLVQPALPRGLIGHAHILHGGLCIGQPGEQPGQLLVPGFVRAHGGHRQRLDLLGRLVQLLLAQGRHVPRVRQQGADGLLQFLTLGQGRGVNLRFPRRLLLLLRFRGGFLLRLGFLAGQVGRCRLALLLHHNGLGRLVLCKRHHREGPCHRSHRKHGAQQHRQPLFPSVQHDRFLLGL